jgi:hypothetical protein
MHQVRHANQLGDKQMHHCAEPCRTFLATTRMYARARARARGFRSQGNRFARFGRFGSRPATGMCLGRYTTHAFTSPTFAPVAPLGRWAITCSDSPSLRPGANTCVCQCGRGWQQAGQWFLPGACPSKTHAGTAAVLGTVCFACPDNGASLSSHSLGGQCPCLKTKRDGPTQPVSRMSNYPCSLMT